MAREDRKRSGNEAIEARSRSEETIETSVCDRDRRTKTESVESDGLGLLPASLEEQQCSASSTVSGGQASKGIRWMPWHQEAMKDVVKLR